MEDKQKQLDEALDRILSGPIGSNSEDYWNKRRNLDLGRHLAQTPKAKAKRVKYHRGVKRPKAFGEKIRQMKLGVKIGHVPSKYVPVIATNVKTKEEIKYDGQVLAAEELNLSVCNISSVLKGRQRTTGGWTFKYV